MWVAADAAADGSLLVNCAGRAGDARCVPLRAPASWSTLTGPEWLWSCLPGTRLAELAAGPGHLAEHTAACATYRWIVAPCKTSSHSIACGETA